MPLIVNYPASMQARPEFAAVINPNAYNVGCIVYMLSFRDIRIPACRINHSERVLELARRVELYESLFGPAYTDDTGRSVTLDLLLDHWGVEVNAEQLTAAQWDKKIKKIFLEEKSQAFYRKHSLASAAAEQAVADNAARLIQAEAKAGREAKAANEQAAWKIEQANRQHE